MTPRLAQTGSRPRSPTADGRTDPIADGADAIRLLCFCPVSVPDTAASSSPPSRLHLAHGGDGGAVTQELDDTLLRWFSRPSDQKKRRQAATYIKKYFTFCVDSAVTPLPLTLVQLMRFAIWLPQNGINSGWKGVKNYTGAVVKYNQVVGQPDPRNADPDLWALLRTRFKNEVQVQRSTATKLPIRQPMVTALAIRAVVIGTATATADMCNDSLANFSAVRIGHFAPESAGDMRHVLRWKDLVFLPSVDTCSMVFIQIDSTKSRHVKECRPTWTAVGRVTSNPLVCPVRWAVEHYRANYRGDPEAPIFANPQTGGPLTRGVYTTRMQTRLVEAVTNYLPGYSIDIRNYSGISWRKGGITALSHQAARQRLHLNQVADFADHQDIATSRSYITDSIETRAAYSDMIAADSHIDGLFDEPDCGP